MKRSHGKHNKGVCDSLYLQDKYKCNDWVVTTAFYSSIHYIDHAIFPCKYKGNEFNDINDAHRNINANSKHQTRKILVSALCPAQAGNYGFLKEESHNARYVNYGIDDSIARLAVQKLELIIKEFDKDKKDLPKLIA